MEKGIQPLAEVFGHVVSDMSSKAKRYRKRRLCPYNNKVPSCTKDKAKDPLGVCSIYHDTIPVITCPIRFRADWIITDDAADFFFAEDTLWTSLTEVRLNDYYDKSAGNIDIVLVAYDKEGTVYDFGALEIQAVYISGNVRDPFAHYMKNPQKNATMDWGEQPNYPRPDYLSSSRKRLAPQLIFKGGILNAWNKKTAVALNKGFYETLPPLQSVSREDADMAWFIYDLLPVYSDKEMLISYKLTKVDTVYTKFHNALNTLTVPKPGSMKKFLEILQSKVDEGLKHPPDNEVITNPFGT